jgi:hypothetical protein
LITLNPDFIFSLPQITGYIAFVVTVVTVAQKDDKRLLSFSILTSLAWIIHWFLMTAYIAAGMNVINTARACGARYIENEKHRVKVFILLMFCYIIYAIFTWQRWFDIFPLTAGMLSCYALFFMNGLGLRFALIGVSFCWLLNGFLTYSIGSVITESFVLSTNLITMIRLQRDRKAGLSENATSVN